MIDPETTDVLIAALWAVAAAVGLWVWTPPLAAAFVGSGYENGGHEDPAAVEPDGTDPEYDELFATLRELGYEPLGPGFARAWFQSIFWTYQTRIRVFRSRVAGRFVFVLRHRYPFIEHYRVVFVTCWDEDRLLTTHGGLEAVYARYPGGVALIHPTENVHELERHHAAAAMGLAAEGWTRNPDLSMENFLRTSVEAARRQRPVIRPHRGRLIVLLAAFAGLVALPAWYTGWWHWLPPLSWIVYTVALRQGIVRHMGERSARLRIKAKQDRSRPPADDTATGTT